LGQEYRADLLLEEDEDQQDDEYQSEKTTTDVHPSAPPFLLRPSHFENFRPVSAVDAQIKKAARFVHG
jgi:hypothetical protein